MQNCRSSFGIIVPKQKRLRNLTMGLLDGHAQTQTYALYATEPRFEWLEHCAAQFKVKLMEIGVFLKCPNLKTHRRVLS